jgi:hypothetical protein
MGDVLAVLKFRCLIIRASPVATCERLASALDVELLGQCHFFGTADIDWDALVDVAGNKLQRTLMSSRSCAATSYIRRSLPALRPSALTSPG